MLITGIRTGIGLYLAQYYAQKEYRVVGISRGELAEAIVGCEHSCVDVSDEKAVKSLMFRIKKEYGRLDVLINNVGVNSALSLAMSSDIEASRKTMDVNFFGSFITAREAAKLMMKNKFGRIINISSMAVKHEVQGEAVYTASKAALTAFSRVFAKEVYPIGITCNVIAPSVIETHLSKAIDPGALAEVLKRNAIPEYGKMEDVSNAIDHFISPSSGSITGQVLYLGGA